MESFWECSTSVFILLFYICFVFIRNPASTLFLLILSRCNFLFRSKCYDIVYYNCKLKLWTFKAGSKNIYGLFIKYILYIHLTNESCKHFKFSPLTRTAQKVVQSFWMLQGLIIANADPSVLWLNNFFLFIYLLLRFAYSGVLLMTVFLKLYPTPKIRNIPIYCNIPYRNPCIVIRIVSPDSCQYTALEITNTHSIRITRQLWAPSCLVLTHTLRQLRYCGLLSMPSIYHPKSTIIGHVKTRIQRQRWHYDLLHKSAFFIHIAKLVFWVL